MLLAVGKFQVRLHSQVMTWISSQWHDLDKRFSGVELSWEYQQGISWLSR